MTPTRRKRIRQLLWLYFWLLIFEGALRKWILPGLSNPLLLLRDPIALVALWWGWPLLRHSPWRTWIQPLMMIGMIALLLAVTVGHGDLPTALYGTRVLVLQLPLIFLYATVFDQGDVSRFAWAFLLLSIPMAMLIAAQSSLPYTHFLNASPGGENAPGFSGALGRSRPPGTFSFTSGVASFFTLAAASLFIVLYGKRIGTSGLLLCTVAGMALVVAVPVSLSRGLLAGYLTVLSGVLAALILSRTPIISLLSGLLAVGLALGLATTIPAFQDTSAAFVDRWETAASQGGADREEVGDVGVATSQLQGRVLPGFAIPFSRLEGMPLLGYGIGMGTNVGAVRLTGEHNFLVGEGSWDSHIGELGPILGLAFILWRVALGFCMFRIALRSALRGNRTPLILVGASLLPVLNGQMFQPTALGFIVLSAGLTLAGANGLPASTARSRGG